MADVRDTLIVEDDAKSVSNKRVLSTILVGFAIIVVGTMIGASIYYENPSTKRKENLLNVNSVAADAPTVDKAKIDNAEYKLITLKGGQEVLLIHDPDTAKLGAAISVHTGSLTDFFKYEGLAHMAEHAMFGGSDKFEINKLLNYCDEMGGDVNAETSDEYTSYMFEMISEETFKEAIDILAHQVLFPKFDENYVFGEAFNVNSEYINSYELDEEKLMKILKVNSRKDGPFYQLTVGTYETLRNGKTLKEFLGTIHRYYSTYYKPKDMKLVLRANLDFVKLEAYANDFFNTDQVIPTSNLQREPPKEDDKPEERYHDINAFPPENRQRLVWWKQNSSTKSANFVFYIDLKDKDTNLVNPHILVEYHFKNFGEGSFAQSLINDGLALNVSADHSTLFSDFTLLYIKVDLTDQGLGAVQDIGNKLFSYIRKIKEADNTALIEEIKKNASKRFDFTEKDPDIFDAITANTVNMHYADKASILNRDYNFSKLTKDAQAAVFKYLTPEYLILLVGTQNETDMKRLNIDQKTQWIETQYQTAYAFRNFSVDEIDGFKKAEANFSLRSSNKFSTGKDEIIVEKECNKNMPFLFSSSSVAIEFLVENCYRTPKVAGKLEISVDISQLDTGLISSANSVLEVINAKIQLKTADLINSITDAGSDASISFDQK